MSDARRTLGKYELQERLGRGGMAEVYKAHHPELDRLVAIKILHPHLADEPDFITRFRREAQAIAQLRHPHIVQVFDFDTDNGQPYMVMEYLPGRSLKDSLDERFARGERLPVDAVLNLFRDLLGAVQYAHAQGMIHRDLKPANVIERPDGRAVLTDFGIARLLSAHKLTATGESFGSPAYMSPEQSLGEAADARSDIYALGVMLYECLTGQIPYEGETTLAVLNQHVNGPIPSACAARPELPAVFDAIIATAMAKDPADRYQSADEMWAALAAVESSAKVTTQPTTRPAPPRRIGVARRRLSIVGGLLVLVLIGLAVVVTPRLIQQSQINQALEEGQARLAAGDMQLAADSFTAALALDPAHTAALLGRARAYEGLALIDDALADVEQVVTLAPSDPSGYIERARLSVQYQSPEPAVVLADLDRAVDLAPNDARAHFVRGWAILNFPLIDHAPDPAAALGDLRRAVELQPQDAEAQFTLARALLASDRAAEGVEAANRAVELDAANPRHWLLRAHLHAVTGDFTAAADDVGAAIEVETGTTALAALYAERAYLHWRLHAEAKAQADAEQAIRLDPGADLPRFMLALVDATAPRPSADEIERARQVAPRDDPIWQAILKEFSP
jgi:tetratricopeptide (TPR) repeat protein/tRNA A-37 threonylcarbamoyl transferase component Bud32